ncbi:HAD family phosphatase [Streptomyces sp. CdTB01]|uniref:HAD family phosphatase n=1 Tax=Streptomyces sp. CdTB01 TaxID=1725411 RepID=UPI000A40BE96
MVNTSLRVLRLAAVDIDGVLLDDSFSPVIHRLAVRFGVEYTPDFERAVFSRPRRESAEYFVRAAGGAASAGEFIDVYFAERERYLRAHPVRVAEGALELLQRLRALGLRIVCYGGLDKEHFDTHLGAWASYFAGPRYVCTNDFRPGIEEITKDVFGLRYSQVVFIDDVASVAERARDLNVPFIGHPGSFPHGHQRRLMEAVGVRHLVDSLSAIDEELLVAVDREASEGGSWQRRDSDRAATVSEQGVR